VGYAKAGEYRAKRVALGLWPHELGLPTELIGQLKAVEDDGKVLMLDRFRPVPDGDKLIEELLWARFLERIRVELEEFRDPDAIRLPPWKWSEVERAVAQIRADPTAGRPVPIPPLPPPPAHRSTYRPFRPRKQPHYDPSDL